MGIGAAVLAGAGLSAVGSVASGVIGSNAAQSAAQTQADAANRASGNQLDMFNTIRGDLSPFRDAGTAALPQLLKLLGLDPQGNPLGAPLTPNSNTFNPTMADLENTPGYKFTLDQGLKATQNSFAAQGLGRSGAALKGAGAYASGLAAQTWPQVFQAFLQSGNLDLARKQQLFNQISGIVGGGQNAAVQTGQFGTTAQTSANNLAVGGANAGAAGTIGSANAIAGGLSGIGSAAQGGINNQLLLSLLTRNNSGVLPFSGVSPTQNQLSNNFGSGPSI